MPHEFLTFRGKNAPIAIKIPLYAHVIDTGQKPGANILQLLAWLFERETLCAFRCFSEQIGLIVKNVYHCAVRSDCDFVDAVPLAVGRHESTLDLFRGRSLFGVQNLIEGQHEPYLTALLTRNQPPIT